MGATEPSLHQNHKVSTFEDCFGGQQLVGAIDVANIFEPIWGTFIVELMNSSRRKHITIRLTNIGGQGVSVSPDLILSD